MKFQFLLKHFFLICISSLCLLYLGFELFFNSYAMLGVDEFWFAHRIYQYKDGLPYQDFSPYKTVLGYYLLLLPMQLTSGILQTLIFLKNSLALLNTVILFLSAYWLTRFFSQIGIIIAFALLLFTEIMLSYSTQIRIDLLAYWFCLFALLCLFEKRLLWAGVLLGLGFATSQKTIWYIAAANGSLLVLWLIYSRTIHELKNIIYFNVMIAIIIAVYITFWSWVSSFHIVLQNIFHDAAMMYELDWYDSARKIFWQATLLYNPLVFLLTPLTYVSVFITYGQDHQYRRRLFIVILSTIILLCLIFYKQVFPYYMQVTIPIFLILYTAFFSWVSQIFQPNITLKNLIHLPTLWVFLIIYSASIISLIMWFQLPYAYMIVSLVPLLFGFYMTERLNHNRLTKSSVQLMYLIILFMAVVYPATLLSMKVYNLDGAYQKENIKAMNSLLADGSDYVAGIELVYNRTQPIAGLRHLMGPAVDYLYKPTKKLAKVMLSSLYEDPNATIDTVLEALQKSQVKFYVNNYRIIALPRRIKSYLASQYQHWWGSIYLYAPTVQAVDKTINIKFSSFYQIESSKGQIIFLNQIPYHANDKIYLNKGVYQTKALYTYRLRLIPQGIDRTINTFFEKDEPNKIIF